jgi:hypothetical protein
MTGKPGLLIVHAGALGDLVCLFPVLQALGRSQRPTAILCPQRLGKLAVAEGLVAESLPIEAAWTASLFAGDPGPEARRLLAPFGRVLAFTRSEALLAGLGRLGVRLCGAAPRPPAESPEHVTAHAFRQVRDCGLLGGAEGSAGPQAGGERRAPAGAGTVWLHPGAGSPRKRWPLSRFCEAAERLAERGFAPEFLIGPAEDDLAVRLKKAPCPVRRLSDPVELAARLRSAVGYIGNDSGASHLAAWVGLPCVVIFGPSDPGRWRPNGDFVEIVRPRLKCRPCFETETNNCAEPACLEGVGSAEVLGAFDRALRRCTRKENSSHGASTQAEGAR